MTKVLHDYIQEFINYKRANGYQYETGSLYLKKYLEFMNKSFPDEFIPSQKSIVSFLENYKKTPGSLYNASSFLKEFSRFMVASGFREAYIIPARKISQPTPVQPYFFTNEEIECFFTECDRLPYNPRFPERHMVFPVMYSLLYCTGMRCKEVRTLLCKNVHLEEGFIDVIQSKGPKSRRIFVSEELKQYLTSYDFILKQKYPDRLYFFHKKITNHIQQILL